MIIIDEDFLKERKLRGSIAAIIALNRWDKGTISEKIADQILEKIKELTTPEIKKFNKKDHTLGHGCMD